MKLGGFEIGVYPLLRLHDLSVLDLDKDTLIAFSEFSIQLDYTDLFNKQIHITQSELVKGNSVIGLDSNQTINLQFIIDSFKSPTEEDSDSSNWDFSISDLVLDLENVNFRFYSIVDSLDLYTGVTSAHILLGGTEMSKVLMECKTLNIEDAFFRMDLGKDTYDIGIRNIMGKEAWINPLDFEYTAQKININTNWININLFEIIALDIRNVNLDASTCRAFDGDYFADIKMLQAESFNQYRNISIVGEARFGYDYMFCENLKLSTNLSTALLNSKIVYGTLDNLVDLKFNDESYIDLQTSINPEDLQGILDSNELTYLGSQFIIDTKIRGNRDELAIEDFKFNNEDSLVIDAKGKVYMPNKIEDLAFNITSDGQIPSQIFEDISSIKVNSQVFSFQSTVEGKLDSMDITSNIEAEQGLLSIDATLIESHLQAKFNADKFPINTYLNDSLYIGQVDFKSEINDYNFTSDLSELFVEGKLSIQKMELNQHDYKDITTDLKYSEGNGKCIFNIDDEFIQAKSTFILDYLSADDWNLRGTSTIDHLDTKMINDSISVNNISTQITFSYKETNNLKAIDLLLKDSKVDLLDSKLTYPKIECQYYETDSLTKGFIASRPIHVNLKSNVKYDSLSTYFTNLLNRYLNIVPESDSIEYRQFDLELNVTEKDPIIEYYTNGFINFSSASLHLNSNNKEGVNGELHLPLYNLGEFTAKNIDVNLNDKAQQLYYKFRFEKAIWDSLVFPNVSAQGILSDSLMTIDLQNINRKDSIANSINLKMILDSTAYWNVSINDDWRLLGRDWTVSGDGLRTNLKRIETADLKFKKGTSEFIINTEQNKFIFEGKNLIINDEIVHYTQFPFNGLLSFRLDGDRGNVEQMTFVSELKIDSLRKDSIYYGQLNLLVTKPDSSLRFIAKGSLIKDNSNTHVSGEYNLSQSIYQTNLRLNRFPLPLIEPFVENIDSLEGEINGNLDLNFRDDKHYLNADLKLKDNAFTYQPFQTNFKIKYGNLKVKDNQLVSDFFILDKENNTAEINGTIGLDAPNALNLLMKTSRFILMDNQEKDNPEFNGKLIIGTNSKILGSAENPDVRAFVSLEEGTSINIYNEDNNVQNTQRNNDIFIFKSDKDSLPLVMEQKDSSIFLHTTIKSNIEIDEKTKLKIVFDPINQDHLISEGGGSLSYELSENGDESLTGTYYITKGEYKTTFQELISKKFEIAENSTLVWFGKKEDPRLNLHTYYNFRTSPYPLVASQSTLSEQEQQLYSGVQSFRLLMDIKGTLSKPKLEFEIESVENDVNNSITAINNEIERINNDPSMLNQQVFSILLFNKFLAINGESAGSNSDVIVNSLGQLVTGELNKLTSEYIDFVDVDLGFSTQNNPDSVGSSYNTSIDIKIEKSFYHDRLKVKFGSVWDVQNNNNNASNKTYKNDFSVEYSITEDGRYRVKVFNKDDIDYDGTDITRNGISVMYSKDFNRFQYLFRKSKEVEIEK